MWDTINLEFRPGICADDTQLAAEGWYVSSDNVRFVRNYPEVIGGWDPLTATTFTGICRGAVQWNTLDGSPRLVLGTQTTLEAYDGTSLRVVTPPLTRVRLPSGAFSTSSGVVTVTHPAHGLRAGDSVTFANATGTGINGARTVVDVLDSDTYTYSGTASTDGGDLAEAYAALPSGPLDASAGELPRTWSLDRFGEMVVASPNQRRIFAGFVGDAAPANLISNGTFSSDSEWAKGTGWLIASGRAYHSGTTESNFSQTIRPEAEAGHYYLLTYKTRCDLAERDLTVSINAGETPALIEIVPTFQVAVSGSYSTFSVLFVMPAAPIDLVFTCDGGSSSVLNLDDVTLTEVEVAPVDQAPTYNNSVFVDSHSVVVALGTVEADGDFNPMCVRNSAISDIRVWVPDTDNVASEIVLSGGGYLIAGCPTRGQNVLWSDTHMFSQRWVGAVGKAFDYDTISRVGLYARFAFAEYNGLVFFVGSDENFNVFDGGSVVPIECPIRDDFFNNLNKAQKSKIASFVHAARSEWWVFYPRGDDDECSHAAVFNFAEKHWTHHTMPRTFGLDSGPFGYPMLFATNSKIYLHEKGTKADGAFRDWHLTTGFFDISAGHNMLDINRHWMDAKNQVGRMRMVYNFRRSARAPVRVIGPRVVEDSTEWLNVRGSGRQLQIHYESADNSESMRLGKQSLTSQKSGARR